VKVQDIPDPGDEDCDGVRTDGRFGGPPDNCPSVRNADQINTDAGYSETDPGAEDGSAGLMRAGDEFGDACDDDDDADGRADTQDNCQFVRNPDQLDRDGDGRGERADGTPLCPPTDADGDGIFDESDNCLDVPNPDQADLDQDRRGDLCDRDDDGDAVPDADDNCPRAPNAEQGDRDGDGIGTACDPGEITEAPAPTPTPDARTANDHRAPRVQISVRARQEGADVAGGMPALVTCSEACGLTATVRVSGRDAKRLRLRSTVVARATAALGGRGRTYLLFETVRGIASRLPAAGMRAHLEVRAVDGAGNRRTVSRRLRLVR
jgi:hypothetical protein